MSPIEQLKKFQDKINSYDVIDQVLKNLIAFELFDCIDKNSYLNKEFNYRVGYFPNLGKDKNFLHTQDSLIEIVKKILQLATIGEIRQADVAFKNRLVNRFRIDEQNQANYNYKSDLSVEELYKFLQDKNSYYAYEQEQKSFPSVMSEKIAIFFSPEPVEEQYNAIEHYLFPQLNKYIFATNIKKQKEYTNLLEKYKNIWSEFYQKIHSEPVKLHIKDFEEFFIFCARQRPIKGAELWYQIEKTGVHSAYKILNLKRFINAVIDDLIKILPTEVIEKVSGEEYQKNLIYISQKKGIYRSRNGNEYPPYKIKKRGMI